jgi:hypothetical protein
MLAATVLQFREFPLGVPKQRLEILFVFLGDIPPL